MRGNLFAHERELNGNHGHLRDQVGLEFVQINIERAIET
jgi:hypothetical protein